MSKIVKQCFWKTSRSSGLPSTIDGVGNTIQVDDTVAYPVISEHGYKPAVHIGKVMRITRKCIWVLPNEQFKDDACHVTIPITNGEPEIIAVEHETDKDWYRYQKNPKFKIIGEKKSFVYDWTRKYADRCIKI